MKRHKMTFIDKKTPSYLYWESCPHELHWSDWRDESPATIFPLGECFLKALYHMEVHSFYTNYSPFEKEIREIQEKMEEVNNYVLYSPIDAAQLYKDKFRGIPLQSKCLCDYINING